MKFFKNLFGGKRKMNRGIRNELEHSCGKLWEMRDKILLWDRLYKNEENRVYGDTKSLNLASCIAAELARLTTMEMKVRFKDEKRFLPVKQGMDFVTANIRRYTEYACAKGGLVFKPFVTDGEIGVDFVQAEAFYPTDYDIHGRIVGAVFVDRKKQDGYIFTRLEKHRLKNNVYRIENEVYKSKSEGTLGIRVGISEAAVWEGICESLEIENVKKPLFAYFKMPAANTQDTNSPLGVSVYSGAVGLIKEADELYSQLLWEFESGKRALYLDSAAYRRDEKGNPILPDKRLYRSADTGTDGLFEDWSPEFREQSILNGLDAVLMKIEDICGLARGTFSHADMSAKTATEIMMLKQRVYCTVNDIQRSLEFALRDLVYAMCVWAGVYGLINFEVCEVGFEFDDSIITDRTREFDERIILLEKGVLSTEEMREWYLGINSKE